MSISDRELAAARKRLREQVARVRAADQDGGDVEMARRVLRYLWSNYGPMVRARSMRAVVMRRGSGWPGGMRAEEG